MFVQGSINSVANIISFVNRHNRGLYLFNIETKSLVKIPSVKVGINSTMHSITKDGENLIYATEDFQIVSLNLKTGEQTRLEVNDWIECVESKSVKVVSATEGVLYGNPLRDLHRELCDLYRNTNSKQRKNPHQHRVICTEK